MGTSELTAMTDEERAKVVRTMNENLWLAEYHSNSNRWYMLKEPYAYSNGPFSVVAVGQTFKEAYDKACDTLKGA